MLVKNMYVIFRIGGLTHLGQTTTARAVSLAGVGLHTGKPSELRLEPLGADSGLRFLRSDVPGATPFRLHPSRVADTTRCTGLRGDSGEYVRTVEHLLAAISLLGIDNAMIVVDSEEIPLGDGSGQTFVELLDDAGKVELDAPSFIRVVDKAYYSQNGERIVAAFPYDGFRVTCIFADEHGGLGFQCIDSDVEEAFFRRDIARARTIGFLREIEALQARGLALGGDIDKAIVIDGDSYVNSPRYPDEPVRHKALDLLGDMAGLGHLRGHIVSVRGGHALNNILARQLAELETLCHAN